MKYNISSLRLLGTKYELCHNNPCQGKFCGHKYLGALQKSFESISSELLLIYEIVSGIIYGCKGEMGLPFSRRKPPRHASSEMVSNCLIFHLKTLSFPDSLCNMS